MKYFILTSVFSFGMSFLHAQEKEINPFESIGKQGSVTTLSNGKYTEVHVDDSLQRVGSVIINMNTGKIHAFLDRDSLYATEALDPTTFSRWYSLDPVVKPNESPYAGFSNNPIWFIDPDGADTLIVHRSEGIETGESTISHVITFSVIQNGVETILPYRFEQAINKEYDHINPPQNSDTKMSFQKMESHKNDENYKYTIRVWIERPSGGHYASFMHPTYYSTNGLKGCMSTAYKLDENGMPIPYHEIDDFGNSLSSFEESVYALEKIYQIYNEEYNIGDLKGIYKGNDFFMRTNSIVHENIEKIEPRATPNKIESTVNSNPQNMLVTD